MTNNASAPDAIAPPRTDEPISKSGSAPSTANDISLDPQKAGNLLHQAELVKNASIAPVVPPADVSNVVVVPPTPEVQLSQLIWGRWQAVLDQPVQNDNVALSKAGNALVAQNGNYSLFRSKGEQFVSPAQGSAGFSLKQSEAVVLDTQTNVQTAATLSNGSLVVNFDKARFATAFDLLNQGLTSKLHAEGAVTSDGLLMGDSQFYDKVTNMNVNGALSKSNGGSAGYLFDTRLDSRRLATGVTYWGK